MPNISMYTKAYSFSQTQCSWSLMETNFSCLDGSLSNDFVTVESWSLGPDNSVMSGALATSVILVLFIVLGVPWNVVVLGTLIKIKFYKEPTSFLLFNLTLVDLLTCVLVMPILAAPGLAGGRYTLGRSDYQLCVTCYFGVMVAICLLYVSMHLQALMSIDRLFYILKPLHYKRMITTLRMSLFIPIIWLISALLSVPPLFKLGEIGLSQKIGTCSPLLTTHTSVGPSLFYVVLLVMELVLPASTLVISNIWLVVILCKSSKKRLEMTQVSTSNSNTGINQRAKSNYTKDQLNMVLMFGLIFISNMITWAPIFISLLYIAGGSESDSPPVLFSLIYSCFLSQSVTHPMLESCLIGSIRQTLKESIHKYWKKTRKISVSGSKAIN